MNKEIRIKINKQEQEIKSLKELMVNLEASINPRQTIGLEFR